MPDEHRNEDGQLVLDPGYVVMPNRASALCAVVASGVAVTLFDTKRRQGGMANYVFPRRLPGVAPTPYFAVSAIAGLVQLMRGAGCRIGDIEARLYGGAENPDSPRFVEGLSEDNVRVGLAILRKIGIGVATRDTGGTRGRKIIFHTGSGETLVACVDSLRASDWYPSVDMARKPRR